MAVRVNTEAFATDLAVLAILTADGASLDSAGRAFGVTRERARQRAGRTRQVIRMNPYSAARMRVVLEALTEHLPGRTTTLVPEAEVAEAWQVSRSTLRRLRRQGELAYVMRGSRVMYRLADLEDFIAR